MTFKIQTVTVTGASGYIGSELVISFKPPLAWNPQLPLDNMQHTHCDANAGEAAAGEGLHCESMQLKHVLSCSVA